MREVAFLETFVEDYTQGEKDVLFAFNKKHRDQVRHGYYLTN